MQYFSLNNNSKAVGFEKAVRSGLAPDRGLYYPQQINPLTDSFWNNFLSMNHHEIALAAIEQFVGDEIPKKELQEIVENTLTFPFPVVELNQNISTLELFHGPTMAFKDVGGRFMARCLGYFNQTTTEKVTVLVATSGDTGGAVASGFLGVPGVEVVILYPKGKVSHIQELQLTTQGQNITALEIDGVFDDCQDMVKTAFLDETLKPHRNLTSANSINVARWLPQSFYYFFAVQELMRRKVNKPFVFSVPSGNFGNICAGFIARELGLPISHFIASTNQNDTFPRYMENGIFEPKPSVQTISNAMDVGNPSNFDRISKLFNQDLYRLKNICSSYHFSDKETHKAMQELFENTSYIADPHGAIGYLGLQKYCEENPDIYGVFLETAHPVKFLDVVEKAIKTKVNIPPQIEEILDRNPEKTSISSYSELKNFLIDNAI
jgi:threonine synthase